MLYADSHKSVAVHLISREDIMNMHRGRYRFFSWLLLVLAIMQLIACGKLTHSAPAITSTNSATFTEGITGSFTVMATGYPNPSFTETGPLPSGVTFTASTGVLSGTPAAGSSGVYPLTITASNGTAPDASQNFTLTVSAASATVLIVNDGTTGTIEADMVANLSTIVTSAGFTANSSVGIPAGDLSSLKQIWDLRYNNTVLTGLEVTSYSSYLQVGGTLVMIGGPGPTLGFDFRNSSIVSLIFGLGGGTIAITNADLTQTVQAPFNQPNAVGSVTFSVTPGGVLTPPGTGALITMNANIGTAIFYAAGTLNVAPLGSLMVVFDFDFLQSTADTNSKNLTSNMVLH